MKSQQPQQQGPSPDAAMSHLRDGPQPDAGEAAGLWAWKPLNQQPLRFQGSYLGAQQSPSPQPKTNF